MTLASGEMSDRSASTPHASLTRDLLSPAIGLIPVALAAGAMTASGASVGHNGPLRLAMALLLAGAWAMVWSAIAAVNWALPLSVWQRWTRGAPLGTLPYTRPDSDAAWMAQRLGELRSWLHDVIFPRYSGVILAGAASLVIVAVMTAALGAQAIVLTVVAMCVPQIAVVLCRGNGRPAGIAHGMMLITLPMLLGHALFDVLSPMIAVPAVAGGLIFAGVRGASAGLRNFGYAVLVGMLIAMREPIGAFALAILWAPQLILNVQRNGYAWLAAGLLAFAVTT